MSQSLAGPAQYESVVKHSRFLARAWPLVAVDEVAELLADACADIASHHCWAWRFGGEYRFHDANEPAGTAGRPILSAIDGQGLDRLLVVVTRWFGGVKLGTGGLVRAYGGCAAECLRLAARQPIVEFQTARLSLPPADQGPVRHLLQTAGAQRLDEGYDAGGLWLRVRVPVDLVDELRSRLSDATAGRLDWREVADGS